MNYLLLFLGGGPLQGLWPVAMVDGTFPPEIVGAEEDGLVSYHRLQVSPIEPGWAATADGRRVYPGQYVYVRSGHQVTWESISRENWLERLHAS